MRRETKKRGREGEGERRNGGRKGRKKEEEKKGVRKEERRGVYTYRLIFPFFF